MTEVAREQVPSRCRTRLPQLKKTLELRQALWVVIYKLLLFTLLGIIVY